MLERVLFPESVGVSSDVFADLIKYFDSINLRVDSVMVVRDGKIACECHWTPNTADSPHDMYSLSKSIVALATGIAVDEGKISLDTKIYPTYFPDKLEKFKGEQREWAEKLTIDHVISMRMGKVTSVFANKQKVCWIDELMELPFKYEPGTKWKYISENAFLLSWIIQKETGMTVTEYLTPRLFEPLDIPVPSWEKEHTGVEAGGWGLRLSAEDLAKISILFLNKGVYNGKRVFSEDWFNKTVYPQASAEEVYPIFTPKTEYGYQTWIDHENNDTTYRFTGLYGQFIYMFPDYNASVVVTASDNRDGEFLHPIYKHFPKAFIEPTDAVDEKKQAEFKSFLDSHEIKPNFKSKASFRNTAKEKEINGKLIKLKTRGNVSTQGATSFFMWANKCGSMNNIKFEFDDEGLTFTFTEKNSKRASIRAGMNGKYEHNVVVLSGNENVIDAQAAWDQNGCLELFFCNVGRTQTRRLTFFFGKGGIVRVTSHTDPGYTELAKFNIEFNMAMEVKGLLYDVIKVGAPIFEKCYTDPTVYGKFVN